MIFRVVPRRDRSLWATLKVHPEVAVHAGRVAWRAGEAPALCVLVRDGAGVLLDAEGQAVGLAGPGDLVGLGAGNPHPCAVRELRALVESRVLPVPAERVNGALRRSATTLREALRALEAGAELARCVAGGAGRSTADVRLARVLREAALRVGVEAGGGRVRVDHVAHRILAQWAGLHRSTVTTLLNEWIYEGTLTQQGRGLVLPPPGGLPGEPAPKR